MRFSTVLFLALLATTTLRAQTLDKFYIGAFWVGGNVGDTIRQPNPGAVATYNEGTLLPSDLPRGRFDEMMELGLNLAGIELHPDSIVRTDANGQSNVLRDITIVQDSLDHQLQLPALPAGTYFLTLRQGESMTRQKLVVF